MAIGNYSGDTRPFIPLLWRLSVPSASALALAFIILRVEPANGRPAVLGAGAAALLVINLVLMRRAFAPPATLTTLMAQADPLRQSSRVELPGPSMQVTLLAELFIEMRRRLESLRLQATGIPR